MTQTIAMDELDGLQLANALRAGIYRLFERTDHINKINVFPVPDGDTGTNMSMTLSAVLAAIDRSPEPHAGTLLVKAADAALDGARGNSGAILAQFLLGLGDGAGHLARLGRREFVAAVTKGASYARDALSQPREGTILTVLREFAQASEATLGQSHNFGELFATALIRVRTSLEATRSQLDELRLANVVDAGALGFVEVLEGMRRFLETGEVGPVIAPLHSGDETMADAGGIAADQDLRFCTECLVTAATGSELDLRQMREEFAAKGASLVISGNKNKARIHIHTDTPEVVFRLAGDYGLVSGQKADDMQLQQSATHHRQTQTIAIVADTGADIPDRFIEQLGIMVVPLRIHFGTSSYLDKVSITPSEFYREIIVNPQHPKTSQPPPGDFRRMFEFLASHYGGVVSINLTARHSGTWDAATKAAERVSPEGKPIRTVDCRNASVGQGLITIAAAEKAAAGGDIEAVVEAAREASDKTRTFALLKDIKFAVRGGRIPAIVGTIAKWLRLNVILHTHPDGRIAAGGGLIGKVKLRQRFAKHVAKQVGNITADESLRILVGHGAQPDEAQLFKEDLLRLIDSSRIEWLDITDMSPAVGVHGGPGTLIVAVQRKVATTSGGA